MILLLHGALATRAQFDPLLPLLDGFAVHTLDFEGHGVAPMRGRSFRSEHFAESVIEWLDARGVERVDLFGYSMGGYVACVVAREYPERVRRIATLGTRYGWDAATLERELRMLDPETMRAKVPRFVEALAAQHSASGWEALVLQTQALLRANAESGGLTRDTLAAISHPVRVMVGDRDTTAGVVESAALFTALPNGQFEALPATPHPFQKVPLARLARSLREFFGGD